MAVENVNENKNEAQCEKCLTVVRFLRSDVEKNSDSCNTSSGDDHYEETYEYWYVTCPCCGAKITDIRFKYKIY
jgi:Zn finger protein HypA/HybF involved in hydrogenase expression